MKTQTKALILTLALIGGVLAALGTAYVLYQAEQRDRVKVSSTSNTLSTNVATTPFRISNVSSGEQLFRARLSSPKTITIEEADPTFVLCWKKTCGTLEGLFTVTTSSMAFTPSPDLGSFMRAGYLGEDQRWHPLSEADFKRWIREARR